MNKVQVDESVLKQVIEGKLGEEVTISSVQQMASYYKVFIVRSWGEYQEVHLEYQDGKLEMTSLYADLY